MVIRAKRRVQHDVAYEYLQIVHSYREGGKVRQKVLATDAEAPFDDIRGCRMRQPQEVSEAVLARAGRYHAGADNLEVTEVRTATGRSTVCRNPEEAERDAAVRQALLEATLAAQGPKAVIRNRGFARFLKVARGAVTIDQEAVATEARLEGTFVLRTNRRSRPRRWPTATRGCGEWNACSERRSRGWRCARSSIIGMTPALALSSPAFWRCGWRWICTGGSRHAVYRSPGPT